MVLIVRKLIGWLIFNYYSQLLWVKLYIFGETDIYSLSEAITNHSLKNTNYIYKKNHGIGHTKNYYMHVRGKTFTPI